MKNRKKVLMLAFLGHPICGQSIITNKMSDLFNLNFIVKVVNFSDSTKNIIFNFFWHFVCILKLLALFGFSKKSNKIEFIYYPFLTRWVYLDGFILLFFLARNVKLIIHHHSYKQINKKHPYFNFLFKYGFRNNIYNIFPTIQHKNRFFRIYNANKKNYFIINSGITINDSLKNSVLIKPKNKLLNIGFLSNISVDKGFLTFLDLNKEVFKNNLRLNFHIAGPFFDNASKTALKEHVKEYKNVKYYGPVYDDEKDKFYRNIDLLAFPSHYESDPVVIYEALYHGILISATNVGNISSVLCTDNFLVSCKNDYIESTISFIKNLIYKDISLYSIQSRNRFDQLKSINNRSLKKLLNKLS